MSLTVASLEGPSDQSRPDGLAVLASRRICIYGMNYAPELIGVGRYSGELGAYLASRGALVEVITSPPHYPGWVIAEPYRANRYSIEHIGDVRVTRCPLLIRAEIRGIWRLLAPLSFAMTSAPIALWRILRMRPDIVLVVEPTLLSAPIALAAAKLVGARSVLHVQDLEIDAAFAMGHLSWRWLERLAQAFERRVARMFDRVVAISNKMRMRLEKKGVPAERMTVVRNWVDLEKIVPLKGPSRYRKKLGLAESAFVVLYSGSIGAKQALPVVLDAAESLHERCDAIFLIAGDGPEKLDLVARYGHLENVRFIGLQPEEDLCEFLNVANVHLLPQLAGAADLVLPSKLGGMLASGKPIIATVDADTELHDFLSGTAIIVPAGDSEHLATAIESLSNERLLSAQGDGRHLAEALDCRTILERFATCLFDLDQK